MLKAVYVYRVERDRNFAPHCEGRYCFLTGCKTTIEKQAISGSWVIGIGGVKTSKPNSLLYIMRVKENLPLKDFRKIYPEESAYLRGKTGGNVLVSENYRYLGNVQETYGLPTNLKHLYLKFRGHRKEFLSDEAVGGLKSFMGRLPKSAISGETCQRC